MKRKAYIFMALLFVMLGFSVYSITQVSRESEYALAAQRQSLFELNVASSRGMIYDSKMQPLVNVKKTVIAAVSPTIESIAELNAKTDGRYREQLRLALENGKPFVFTNAPADIIHDDILLFNIPERYQKDQLASHTIGYIDSAGRGVSGIEKAMDDYLSKRQGEISIRYRIDAMGRVIAGDEKTITNTMEISKAGVVTTIDADIQKKVEELGGKLTKGAVIVSEAPSAEIRAIASFPSFSPLGLADAANVEDNPLINRTMLAYTPGSVFKLVLAAQMYEEKLDGHVFNCTGAVYVDGMRFTCFDEKPHGKVTLGEAIAQSCNGYFINASLSVNAPSLLAMAQNLGFEKELEFGRGLYTEAGNLPDIESLSNKRALANFSFGQGELMVTPLQVNAMINTISAGGNYTEPKLFAGYVDEDLQFQSLLRQSAKETTRVMLPQTAQKLRTAMEKAAKTGTGKKGNPQNCIAGIKTGTAQTGQYVNGQELNHFWYSGYIRDKDGPRYNITVLKEFDADDGKVTAQVFREVATYLAENAF